MAPRGKAHADAGAKLRRGLPGAGVARPRILQHGRRRLRQARRRYAPAHGAYRRGRGRRRHRLQLPRPQDALQQTGQLACRQGAGAGRADRHPAVPVRGDRRHPYRRMEGGVRLHSAVYPVRRGRARVPPGQQRRPRPRHRRRQRRQGRSRARPPAPPATPAGDGRRQGRRRHHRLLARPGDGIRRFYADENAGRGSRPHHLHVGHDGQSEGGAPRPPRAPRPPSGSRVPPRVLPPGGRLHVDAGRLGLDRRLDERAHVVLAPRGPGARLPGPQVRPRGRPQADERAWRAQHLHAADGAAPDAPGAGHRQALRP